MDNGEPLNYTEEIADFTNAAQNAGARLNKYEWSATDQWERDNDWVLMRYAEILMMQAECNFRLGYIPTALTYINQIRKRAGLTDLTSLTLDDIDTEWKHEFVFEGLRRTTNIRLALITMHGGRNQLILLTITPVFIQFLRMNWIRIRT